MLNLIRTVEWEWVGAFVLLVTLWSQPDVCILLGYYPLFRAFLTLSVLSDLVFCWAVDDQCVPEEILSKHRHNFHIFSTVRQIFYVPVIREQKTFNCKWIVAPWVWKQENKQFWWGNVKWIGKINGKNVITKVFFTVTCFFFQDCLKGQVVFYFLCLLAVLIRLILKLHRLFYQR